MSFLCAKLCTVGWEVQTKSWTYTEQNRALENKTYAPFVVSFVLCTSRQPNLEVCSFFFLLLSDSSHFPLLPLSNQEEQICSVATVRTDRLLLFSWGTVPISYTQTPSPPYSSVLPLSESGKREEMAAASGTPDSHRARKSCEASEGPITSLETNKPDVCHPHRQLQHRLCGAVSWQGAMSVVWSPLPRSLEIAYFKWPRREVCCRSTLNDLCGFVCHFASIPWSPQVYSLPKILEFVSWS